MNRMINRCKNITLSQTSFAGGNKETFQWQANRLLSQRNKFEHVSSKTSPVYTQTEWQKDRHDWKHYLPTTSLKCGKHNQMSTIYERDNPYYFFWANQRKAGTKIYSLTQCSLTVNECDWHILAGNEERIKSHCLTRKYYARSVGKLDWFGSSNCKQNDLRSWCVCYRLSKKWELFSLIYCLLLLSLLRHWCFNNLNDLDFPTCESGKFESLEADCMDFCFKPNGKSFLWLLIFYEIVMLQWLQSLFEWKAYSLTLYFLPLFCTSADARILKVTVQRRL